MKHLGDKEGPAMLNSLKGCEKAIGEKFATDAQSDVSTPQFKPQPYYFHQVHVFKPFLFILQKRKKPQ